MTTALFYDDVFYSCSGSWVSIVTFLCLFFVFFFVFLFCKCTKSCYVRWIEDKLASWIASDEYGLWDEVIPSIR